MQPELGDLEPYIAYITGALKRPEPKSKNRVAPSNLQKASAGEAVSLGSMLFRSGTASVQCMSVPLTPEGRCPQH